MAGILPRLRGRRQRRMDKLMEPSATLQWVDRTLVKPNDYNPNKVSKQNLELLTQSIFTNGWTLPIVVRPDYTIPQMDCCRSGMEVCATFRKGQENTV